MNKGWSDQGDQGWSHGGDVEAHAFVSWQAAFDANCRCQVQTHYSGIRQRTSAVALLHEPANAGHSPSQFMQTGWKGQYRTEANGQAKNKQDWFQRIWFSLSFFLSFPFQFFVPGDASCFRGMVHSEAISLLSMVPVLFLYLCGPNELICLCHIPPF